VEGALIEAVPCLLLEIRVLIVAEALFFGELADMKLDLDDGRKRGRTRFCSSASAGRIAGPVRLSAMRNVRSR
jgi:hypothetical protein